ncbi:hypothetical protein HX047_01640 [Myroides marinus]|nr:hypothetical protein [Myroides marinus]
MILDFLNLFITSFIAPTIAFIGTMVVAGISIYHNRKTTKENRKFIERNDLVERKKEIEKKINEFYIPLRSHLEQSKTLFKIFMKDKPNDFRTLTYLLNPAQEYGESKIVVELNENDKSLLEIIINIGEKIENLINEKGWLIGHDIEFVEHYQPSEGYKHINYDKDLNLINLLISHIIAIRLAFKGQIKGQINKFEGFVFPNEINSKITKKIEALKQEIKVLELQIENTVK